MGAVHRLGAAAIAATLAFAAPAQAQTVNFVGFTSGCFFVGVACTPSTGGAGPSQTMGGLTYNSSTFNGTTSAGFLSIGNAPGTPNVDNFGSFSLNGTPLNYTTSGQDFVLRVTFTAPAGTTPNTTTFTTDVFGNVSSNDVGGVSINFLNPTQNFTYTGGSFTLSLNNTSLIPGGTVALTGNIIATQTTVPEPSTYLLLASGLAGMGLVYRRTRKA